MSVEIIRLQNQVDDLGAALRASEGKLAERITEAAVAGYLGQETARMMQMARETSDALVQQATERVERLTTEAKADADRLTVESRATAEKLRKDSELEARTKRAEADRYAEATRTQADAYSHRSGEAARADADATRRQAAVEAERLLRETMDHRTTVLRELARRRDLAAAQVRAMLSGRDVIVEALDQVRLASVELIDGLEEISVSPSDFVSLDPEVEGLTMDRGVALSVRRGGAAGAKGTKAESSTMGVVVELPVSHPSVVAPPAAELLAGDPIPTAEPVPAGAGRRPFDGDVDDA